MTAHFPVSYHSSSTHTSLPVGGRELPVPEGEREWKGRGKGYRAVRKSVGGKKEPKKKPKLRMCNEAGDGEKGFHCGPNNIVIHISLSVIHIMW